VTSTVPTPGLPSAEPAPNTDEDTRLARLHLRLGMLTAARAELEDLEQRGALGRDGRAALAEARWRSGDLEAAGEAALAHLAAGGSDLAAIVIAAEAAVSAGQPADARALMDQVAGLDAAALDAVFAGVPRRAHWPAAVAAEQAADGSPAAGAAAAAAAEMSGTARADGPPPGMFVSAVPDRPTREAVSAIPRPGDVLAATTGLWDEIPGAGGTPPGPPRRRSSAAPNWVEPARAKGHADPRAELEAAREELGATPDRGLLRLALVLRLDPSLAPDVLEAVRLRREPAAAVLRGDAQRLLGRHLEAEAAFADAIEAIEREALATRHHGQPERPPDHQEDS
jgi:hypothetical protein